MLSVLITFISRNRSCDTFIVVLGDIWTQVSNRLKRLFGGREGYQPVGTGSPVFDHDLLGDEDDHEEILGP